MYPKLVDLGPFPIHTYGLLLATAILIALSLMARLAETDGLSRKRAWDLGFVIILSSILGAKLLLILTSWDYYMADLSRLFSLEFLQAGGVYYGGLIGAILGGAIYVRMVPGFTFWRAADTTAPAIPLGQAIGRLGCFAAGCDYGCPTDLPWAVTFTSEYANRVVGVPLNVRLHPYQLYESFSAFLLCLMLLYLFKKRVFYGQTFCQYLIGYGILRFVLEFFRGDVDRGFLFGGLLSTSQFISLLIVPVAIVCYIVLSRDPKRRIGDQR
jgi:phosphatidylglycerol:prolipoprotein diacylglycerol transferase